jgi:hypothetical protein
VKVRFSRKLTDFGVFDLEAVPRGGEVVLLPGTDAQLKVWNVAWRLDGEEPCAVVFLMTESEYMYEMSGGHR